MVFPVVMYGLWEWDHEGGWAPENWCFWTVVLKKTVESPLDCKEIQPVHPKGDQSWIFIRGTYAEAEALILWPPDAKSQLKDREAWSAAVHGVTKSRTQLSDWTKLMYVDFLDRMLLYTQKTTAEVNITSICTRKPKSSCDLLYCNIHFIMAIWNWTHSIWAMPAVILYYSILTVVHHIVFGSL